MSRQEIKPINAGSMADIAFLLLIFFLVTTTMDVDKGILHILPAPDEEQPPIIEVHKNKVLHIQLNDNDDLLLEEKEATLEDIKGEVQIFMTNGGVFDEKSIDPRHVSREWIDRDGLEQRVTSTGSLGQSTADTWRLKKEEDILDAIALFGPYKSLHKSAVIHLEHSSGASYDKYIQVVNEIDAGLNELRDELSHQHSDKDYLK